MTEREGNTENQQPLPANSLGIPTLADHNTVMLLLPWSLVAICVVLGAVGFGIAYKQRRSAVIPVIAALAIVVVTLLQLRDPLSLAPEYRAAMQDWSYVAALLWSTILAITLPLVGKYLGSRKKN